MREDAQTTATLAAATAAVHIKRTVDSYKKGYI